MRSPSSPGLGEEGEAERSSAGVDEGDTGRAGVGESNRSAHLDRRQGREGSSRLSALRFFSVDDQKGNKLKELFLWN